MAFNGHAPSADGLFDYFPSYNNSLLIFWLTHLPSLDYSSLLELIWLLVWMHDDAHCNKKCTPRGHCCVLELETLLAEVQQARAFRCQVVPRKEGRCSNAITQVSSALACNDSKKKPSSCNCFFMYFHFTEWKPGFFQYNVHCFYLLKVMHKWCLD